MALGERVGVEPDDETVATFRDRLAEAGPMDQDEAEALARREFSS